MAIGSEQPSVSTLSMRITGVTDDTAAYLAKPLEGLGGSPVPGHIDCNRSAGPNVLELW